MKGGEGFEKENPNKREDLIGTTGTVTRRIEIVDAHEGKFGVDIRVQDNKGDEYWTAFDDDISLD